MGKKKSKKVEEPKWDVTLKQVGPNSYITEFYVENQGFTIASASEDEEAKHHCELMRDLFLKALAKLGIKKKENE